ncbi:MAG: hypothetical protein AAGF99_12475 [Bacteroidota bacterium]
MTRFPDRNDPKFWVNGYFDENLYGAALASLSEDGILTVLVGLFLRLVFVTVAASLLVCIVFAAFGLVFNAIGVENEVVQALVILSVLTGVAFVPAAGYLTPTLAVALAISMTAASCMGGDGIGLRVDDGASAFPYIVGCVLYAALTYGIVRHRSKA